jgi:hypothetical protein
MRRFLPLASALAVAMSLAVASTISASATSGAHFFKDTSASVNDNGALVVTIDEAGVGQSQVNYTLTASASATWACINGGGNHPKAANKETVTGQVSATASFSPINGRVMGTIGPTGPLSPGGFTCPSGQTLVLAAVSYSNIVLTDTTNGVTDNLGSVSRTFFNL